MADTLRQRGGSDARLIILAEVAYADQLRPHFTHVEEPMKGMGLGFRQRWLNWNTQPLAADAENETTC